MQGFNPYSKRPTKSGTRSVGPRLSVVLVAEPFATASKTSLQVFPLAPLSPSEKLPFALLPVCNTPLIDYALENLLLNNTSEVSVLVNRTSEVEVSAYLRDHCTARGRPWLQCDSMKVKVHRCVRDIVSFASAIAEVRDQDIVPQKGFFLLATIDQVCFCPVLRDVYAVHAERARTIDRYIATLVCTSTAGTLLGDTLYNELVLEEQRSYSHGGTSPILGDHSGFPDDLDQEPYVQRRPRHVPQHPGIVAPLLLVMERDTQVVSAMSFFTDPDTMAEPPVVAFSAKRAMSVRMDLEPTGLLFLDCAVLADVEDHNRDICAYLNETVLGQAELLGQVFGVYDLPREAAVVRRVDHLHSYIDANVAACARLFYPMTRESCFAEAKSAYTVAASCGTVYFHAEAHCASRRVGPHVVVGPETAVAAGSTLRNTILGARVTVDDACVLDNCVVMDGVHVGRGCILRDCVLGPQSSVDPGTVMTACILCDSSRAACLPGDSVYASKVIGCGDGGAGTTVVGAFKSVTRPIQELFTADSDEDDESEDTRNDRGVDARLFRVLEAGIGPSPNLHTILTDINAMVLTEAGVERGLNNPDRLGALVTRQLFEHIHRANASKGVAAALASTQDMLSNWCGAFYNDTLAPGGRPSREVMAAVLRGLQEAMGLSNHVLGAHGSDILRLMHVDCDTELSERRGYCIVSTEALRAFAAEARKDEEGLGHYRQDMEEDSASDESSAEVEEEQRMLQQWQRRVDFARSCRPYLESLPGGGRGGGGAGASSGTEESGSGDDDSDSEYSDTSASSSSISIDYDL